MARRYPGTGLHIFAPSGNTGTVNAYGGSGRDIFTGSNHSTAIRNLDGGTDFDVVIVPGKSGGVARPSAHAVRGSRVLSPVRTPTP